MSDLRDRSNEISRLAQSPTGRWVVTGIAGVVVIAIIVTGIMARL